MSDDKSRQTAHDAIYGPREDQPVIQFFQDRHGHWVCSARNIELPVEIAQQTQTLLTALSGIKAS